MPYLVIETFPELELATIVTDEEGKNIIFETEEEAQIEANDCQEPIIVFVQ